jgi:glycosyltransferase involved in cell wall biosynthesis
VKVLILDLSARFGGADTRALQVAEGLSRQDTLLGCLAGSPIHRQAADADLRVYALARHKLDWSLARRLGRLIEREGIQLIDSQNVQSRFWGGRAALQAPVALVSTLNSWYPEEYPGLRGRLYQALERRGVRRTDLFIAVSTTIREHLGEWGVDNDRIAVIPNAIGLAPSEGIGDPAGLRRELGLGADTRLCCAVGRLVEAKGFDLLVDAMASVGDPKVHCVIVGGGGLEGELRDRTLHQGLAGRVHLLGYRDRAATLRILAGSDLFVLSSRTEGTPLAVLEAAALGIPIVATGVGGVPTMLTDGESARLVPPGQSGELARAISSLLADPQKGAALGRRARARVVRQFGPEAQLSAINDAYQRALERAAHRLGRPLSSRWRA